MRRQPPTIKINPRDRPAEWGPDQQPQPGYVGDVVSPFLQTGGATFYLTSVAPPFDARPDGVQLLASVFVPEGWVGFVKEIRVAPGMPPELADPWEVQGGWPNPPIEATLWRTWDAAPTVRVAGTHGIWQTPFGWESYYDDGEAPPSWTWHLRLIPGDVLGQRAGLPAFSVADPTTWFFVPNVPVPNAGYPTGIPGSPPSGQWPQQRMQVLQGDKLSTHVFAPENTTIALFARWTQAQHSPWSHQEFGEGTQTDFYGPPVYPIQPSFGSLHGYMQAAGGQAARENALYGWEG